MGKQVLSWIGETFSRSEDASEYYTDPERTKTPKKRDKKDGRSGSSKKTKLYDEDDGSIAY